MFDILRNVRKSKVDKRQEAISAYLDNELSAADRRQFEQQLAADPSLRNDVEQQRFIKLNISRLPKLKAPRRFTLDPGQYGRPIARGYFKLYPAMRVATALAGIFFVLALGIEFLNIGLQSGEFQQADQVSQLNEAEPELEMMVEAESAMAEGEGPLKFQQMPAADSEIVEENLETELAAEEAAPAEAPAEEAVQLAEPQFQEESEGDVAEIESPSPDTGEPAAEREVAEETIVEEVGVGSPLPSVVPGVDGAETPQDQGVSPAATPILPTGGGGVRPEGTPQEPTGTAPAVRATVTDTETPASPASLTPSPTQPTGQEVAQAEDRSSEEDSDMGFQTEIEPVPVPTRQLPQQSQEPSPEVPWMRLIIAVLGIAVFFLAAVTLLLRQQTKL